MEAEIRDDGIRDVAYLTKIIKFLGRSTPIVLQNTNGRCLLPAICNVLLLRNELDLSLEIENVSDETLLSLIRDKIMGSNNTAQKMLCQSTAQCGEKLTDVIGLLDHLPLGIFANPRFRKIDDFEPMSEFVIFDLLGINLYHGWIVDPEDIQTSQAIESLPYNSITTRLVPFHPTNAPSDISTSEKIALDFSSPNFSSNQRGRGDWEEYTELLRVLQLSKVETTIPLHQPKSPYFDSDHSSHSSNSSDPEVNLAYPLAQIEAESDFPSISGLETIANDDVTAEDQSRKTCTEDASASRLCQTPKNYMQERCIANYSVKVTPDAGALVQAFLSKNASQLTDHGLKCLHEGVKDMELCILFRNNQFNTMIKYREGIYLLITDLDYIDNSDVVWERLSEINGDAEYVNGNFEVVWAQNQIVSSSERSDCGSDLAIAQMLQEKEFDLAEQPALGDKDDLATCKGFGVRDFR